MSQGGKVNANNIIQYLKNQIQLATLLKHLERIHQGVMEE